MSDFNLTEFWESVDQTTTPNGCWLWTGKHSKRGTGVLCLRGRNVPAHIVAWQLIHGQTVTGAVAEGDEVRRTCGSKDCCNPKHLLLWTQEYAQQKPRDGRCALTEQQVVGIRSSDKPLAELAEEYGVTVGTISHIRTGRIWKHLQSEDL